MAGNMSKSSTETIIRSRTCMNNVKISGGATELDHDSKGQEYSKD